MEQPTGKTNTPTGRATRTPPLWLVLLMAALAGGMGWGIRGQYGHDTGAMVPGLLVALVITFLFSAPCTSWRVAKAISLTAIGIALGGSMTYGQTVGLTHDVELVGNWGAFWWGMLGLFVKGGVWIGFAGAFLGIGLSDRRYRPLEMAILGLAMTALLFVGQYVLNEPFAPGDGKLPAIYFSDHWHWEPDKVDLKPRPERWGGLALALAGLTAYLALFKKDRLARNMAWVGIISGGLGFALGQSIQAFHAWNPQRFQDGLLAKIDPYMNWWNTMETTFGLVLGLGLGLGVWLNRGLVSRGTTDAETELAPNVDWLCIALQFAAVASWEFGKSREFIWFAGHAVTVAVLPMVAIVGGRFFPYMLAFPLLALPIAGKTLLQLSYKTDYVSKLPGWLYLFAIPMALMVSAAFFFEWRGRLGQSGRSFARWALLLATWFYFALNFAFFELPWPWKDPTGRSISAAVFTLCAVTLTVGALAYGWRDADSKSVDTSA